MPEGKSKYHHLIPQTYLAAWEHGNGTLYVRFKDRIDEVVERNKANLAGYTNYHTIFAGMPIVEKEDADFIFKCVSDFEVRYKGSVISDSLVLNRNYWDFENWSIYRKDGSVVSNKRIKAEIDQAKIRDIEDLWAKKYENKWSQVRSDLTDRLTKATGGTIPAVHKEYLVEFFTALDWRSFISNELFNGICGSLCNDSLHLNEIEIPEQERKLYYCRTASEEIRHALLLKMYRQFLQGTGPIYNQAMAALGKTSFCFLIAGGQAKFITSDNPAFIYEQQNGQVYGMMPISPEILLFQGKDAKKSSRYYVRNATDEEVGTWNAAIEAYASQFLVQLSPNAPRV